MLQRNRSVKQELSAGRAGLKADTEGRVWWQEAWTGIRCARMGEVGMSKTVNTTCKRLRLEKWF